MSAAMTYLKHAAAVLILFALAALPAPVYDGYFDGHRHQVVIVAAALAGTIAGVVAGLGTGWRRAALAVLAALSAVPVLIGLFDPATHGVPTVALVQDLGTDVLHGWARMTTTGTPAAAQPEVLALPAAAAWLSAFIGVLALRDPARRLLPALPAFAAFAAGLVLTAASGPPRWLLAGAMVALLVLLLLLRPGPAPLSLEKETDDSDDDETAQTLTADGGRVSGGSPLTTVTIGLVLLAVLAGIAVAGVHALPAQALRTPYDPRADVHPATELIDASSPMIGIKRQLKPPVQQLFSVRVVKSQLLVRTPDAVRVAALDSFDGSTWQVSGQYLRPGARIPGDGGLRRPLEVTLQVTTGSLSGPLLPTLTGRTQQLDLPEVRIDVHGTNAIATRAIRSGQTYQVTGVVPGGTQKDLASAAPDLSGDAAGTTALPDLPPEFRALATRLTASQSEPYAQLTAIKNWLRALPYGTDGPPGESYAMLEPILFGTGGDGKLRPASFSEQRVSAFAVLARAAGFPARVAVGYKLDPRKEVNGQIPVTSSDVVAWAEVKMTGYGWVRFDPTDEKLLVDRTPKDSSSIQQQQSTGTSSDQSVIDPGLTPDDVQRTGGGGLAGVIPWLLLLLALVPVLLVLGGLAKVVRRRRRGSAGGPRDRVLGAWRESGDRLLEFGRPPARSQTAVDVATELGLVLGDRGRDAEQALLALGPMVDHAMFAPADPDPADVATAWDAYDRLRMALDAAAPLWVRPIRRLNPRPLWHRPGSRVIAGGPAWPAGLRTPTPDATHLAPILIDETVAAAARGDAENGSENLPVGAASDPEQDLLIESMLSPSAGTTSAASDLDDILVESPGGRR